MASWPAAEVVKTAAWNSSASLLSGARVNVAVVLIDVAVFVPVTAGAPVGTNLTARQEESTVEIVVKGTPNYTQKTQVR